LWQIAASITHQQQQQPQPQQSAASNEALQSLADYLQTKQRDAGMCLVLQSVYGLVADRALDTRHLLQQLLALSKAR
jgi:hypothetical protein